MELQARVRVWGRPRGRSGIHASRVSSTDLGREDARVGAGPENYVKFRKSFNLWVKNGPAEGEKEPRGTAIGDYGRLQPDIWGAMFDLYEYNLRDELGEDSGGVATLRQGLTWVDGGKKAAGFGEKHPTTENAVDGMRSQADRRVEVLMFDDGEEPNLAATNGEDIYDGVTFERRRVEYEPPPPGMRRLRIRLLEPSGRPLPPDTHGIPYRLQVGKGSGVDQVSRDGWVKVEYPKREFPVCHIEWGTPDSKGSFPYSRFFRTDYNVADARSSTCARLHNLGYCFEESSDEQFDVAITRFQEDQGLPVEPRSPLGTLPTATQARLDSIYRATYDASQVEPDEPVPASTPDDAAYDEEISTEAVAIDDPSSTE